MIAANCPPVRRQRVDVRPVALEAAPPEMQQLIAALRHNPTHADRFISTIAGTVSIPDFFALENLDRIIGGAEATAA